MSLIRQAHAGRPYRSDWGTRMTGDGPYAEMLRLRFETGRRTAGAEPSPSSVAQGPVRAAAPSRRTS